MKSTSNHQMDNQEVFFVEDKNDLLSKTTNRANLLTDKRGWRRVDGSQHKRARNPHAFQRSTQNASLERFDIDHNIRQLGHGLFHVPIHVPNLDAPESGSL